MYKTQFSVHAVIGFSGEIKDGLNLHFNNEDLVYAIGSSLICKNSLTGKQFFMKQHSYKISAVKISPNGKYVVTGEVSEIGQQATIIVWDFYQKIYKHKLKLHKSQVTCLDFSKNQFFLCTQGGKEDKNMLIIWDLQNGKSLYGTPNKREVKQVKYYHDSDSHILTITETQVQIQIADKANKKVVTQVVDFNNIKRNFLCGDIDANDEYAYVGTNQGDFHQIDLQTAMVKRSGPPKKSFTLGITNLKLIGKSNQMIVGTGDGTVARISLKNMQVLKRTEIMGSVTSIAFNYDLSYFFCGTDHCSIFLINSLNLSMQLKSTAHSSRINDVAFPQDYSDVFATCSYGEIRLWNIHNQAQLLRIQIPGTECHCVGFPSNGKSIVSGWSDGRIRAFLPQSGKLLYVINEAHLKGVTALGFFKQDSTRIISGGAWGQVRVWKIKAPNVQYLITSLKQHCGRVTSIQLIKNNKQAISCSLDGSCVIWNMQTFDKINSFEQFQSPLTKALIHPKQYQFITISTNGNIMFRELFDVQLLKNFQGVTNSNTNKKKNIEKQAFLSLQKQKQFKNKKKQKQKMNYKGVNALALTNDGASFLTGGGDKILKLWDYDFTKQRAVGIGHSGIILKIGISPNKNTVVSISEEGEIFFWDIPADLIKQKDALSYDLKPMGRDNSTKN